MRPLLPTTSGFRPSGRQSLGELVLRALQYLGIIRLGSEISSILR